MNKISKIKRVKIINKFVKITQWGGELGKLNNSFFKLLFLVIFFNLLSFSSFGFEDTKNGVMYSFNNGTLTISKDESVSDNNVPKDGNNMPKREVSENGVQNAMSSHSGIIAIEKVIIKEGITSIGEKAFYWCESLSSITIPDGVTNIGDYAFGRCIALQSVIIPEGVTSIGDWAFANCISLTSIIMPNSVANIGDWAFANCTSLTSIIMPNGVTNIGDNAFYNCENLQDVYYLGTKVGWGKLEISSNGNAPLDDATIHCNCNILTVKKVWDDNNNSGLRRKPTFVLYKANGASGYDKINNEGGEEYKELEVTYVNGLPVEFDNVTRKVINGDGAEKDVWLCKFIIFNHVADNKYAVGEKRMENYTSEAYVD